MSFLKVGRRNVFDRISSVMMYDLFNEIVIYLQRTVLRGLLSVIEFIRFDFLYPISARGRY